MSEAEIKVATNQAELESLFKTYLEKRIAHQHTSELRKALQPPAPVKVFNSLEEMRQYRIQEIAYNTAFNTFGDEIGTLMRELKAYELAVVKSLPVPNVWLRVGYYAIGYFYSTWGGGHYELTWQEWSDNLPTLTDRVYFP